jgi:hypothetical protein
MHSDELHDLLLLAKTGILISLRRAVQVVRKKRSAHMT